MATSQEYRNRITRMGLDKFEIKASSVPEAKEALKFIRETQKHLRQIKREINQDMKNIRAGYNQKGANAASGTSAILTIAGKKKLAGQARADAKRRLRNERDNLLQPYENVKIIIDDLISQLDAGKATFLTVIEEVKVEKQAEKQRIEAYHHSLLTMHLKTPNHEMEYKFVPQNFDVAKPIRPINDFDYSSKPSPPILAESDFLTKVFSYRQKKVDKINQEMMQKYKEKLAYWDERRKRVEDQYVINEQEYSLLLQDWKDRKTRFENEQEKRRRLIEEKRLIDVESMQIILSEKLQSITWPIDGTGVSFQIQENGSTIIVDLNLPNIEDWPIKKGSSAQRKKDYITHIHSIGFYTIGEVFFVLPSASTVVLSSYVKRPSKTTGQLCDEYLYSVKVSRSKWQQLNFECLDALDIVACFKEFDILRKITAQGVITPIEPFKS